MRVAILIPSDRAASGERPDATGPALEEAVKALGSEVRAAEVVPDEREPIQAALLRFCDDLAVDLVLVAGGTGLGPRDVTPEATRAVIDREVPGIPEAMRAKGLGVTSHAMLSRAVAGVRGRTLIVNLPGSPKGAVESLGFVKDALPHAVEILHGGTD
jgi:molybdenum cofactor synthesis domain-containing protein